MFNFLKKKNDKTLNKYMQGYESPKITKECFRSNYGFKSVINFVCDTKIKIDLIEEMQKVLKTFPALKDILTLRIEYYNEGNHLVRGSYNPEIKTITIYQTQNEYKHRYFYTFYHELAHAIIDLYCLDIENLNTTYQNELDCSIYSQTSKEEYFCELFANYYTSSDLHLKNIARKTLIEFFKNLT